jgi:hypothetical protein
VSEVEGSKVGMSMMRKIQILLHSKVESRFLARSIFGSLLVEEAAFNCFYILQVLFINQKSFKCAFGGA